MFCMCVFNGKLSFSFDVYKFPITMLFGKFKGPKYRFPGRLNFCFGFTHLRFGKWQWKYELGLRFGNKYHPLAWNS